MNDKKEVKPLFWVGNSKNDLREFPEDVQDAMGYALHHAQIGEKHKDAKPLRGFGGAGVLEVVEDYDGIHIVLFIPSSLRVRFMLFMPSRRKQGVGRKHRNRAWI